MAGRGNQRLSLDRCRYVRAQEEEHRKQKICWRKAKLLTEAEEQRVHAHGVHTEEAVGDEV